MPATVAKTKTVQYRDFSKGVNQTASRPSLDDKELFWLENAQPIGPGNIQILQPPAAAVATIAAGIATQTGITIKIGGVNVARIITVNNDGSMSSVDPTNGNVVTIAPAATVTTAARITMWQDNPLLIGDLVKGYFSWDGTTLMAYPAVYTGTTTIGSQIITSIGPVTTGLAVGMHLLSPSLPSGTTIASVDSTTQIHASANATANGAIAITVGAGAPTKVADLATFEGSVELVVPTRTITITAPASYTDFQIGDGAFTTAITDSVFAGSIIRILSALEVLWVLGPAAVNAISNLQLTGGIRTLSNTNIVANVGTLLPSSVNSFFRTFLFLAPYGVYAIIGATPQKLSENLDGLFPNLTFGTDQPSGVLALNRVFVWCVLVTYTDPATKIARPVLLCFSRNAWFIAAQGNSLKWITSVINLTTGNPELWGTDGSTIFKCFAGTTAASFSIQTKFFDFGAFTTRKQLLRLMLEVQNLPAAFSITATATNEDGETFPITLSTQQTVVNFTSLGGVALTFTGAGSVPIRWIVSSLQPVGPCNASGNYIGINVSGATLPFVLSGIAMEIEPLGEWVL